MHWNYRILKTNSSQPEFDDFYQLCEVFYEEGTIMGMVLDPGCPSGESPDEAKEDWELMGLAFDAPTLDHDEAMREISLHGWSAEKMEREELADNVGPLLKELLEHGESDKAKG